MKALVWYGKEDIRYDTVSGRRDFETPPDFRAEGTVADAIPALAS